MDHSNPWYRIICVIRLSAWKKLNSWKSAKVRATPGPSTRPAAPWLWGCVPMHYLPGAFLCSKDIRSPKCPRGGLLPSTYLGLAPLYLHYVGKLGSYVFLYDLGPKELAISERRCATVRSLSDLLPRTGGNKGLLRVTSSPMEKNVLQGSGFPLANSPCAR